MKICFGFQYFLVSYLQTAKYFLSELKNSAAQSVAGSSVGLDVEGAVSRDNNNVK